MKITFDLSRRDLVLKHRGLDFARAGEVFAGLTATIADERLDKRVHARLRRAMAVKRATSSR